MTKQTVLEHVVKLAAPVAQLTEKTLPLEAQALQRPYRGCVLRMHLGFYPVEVHVLEAPGKAGAERLVHVALASRGGVQFITKGAFPPCAVPGKESAGAGKRGLTFDLDSPACTWIGQGTPMGEDFDEPARTGFVLERIDAKPAHGFRVAVDGEQGRGVGVDNLAQYKALGVDDREAGWIHMEV